MAEPMCTASMHRMQNRVRDILWIFFHCQTLRAFFGFLSGKEVAPVY